MDGQAILACHSSHLFLYPLKPAPPMFTACILSWLLIIPPHNTKTSVSHFLITILYCSSSLRVETPPHQFVTFTKTSMDLHIFTNPPPPTMFIPFLATQVPYPIITSCLAN